MRAGSLRHRLRLKSRRDTQNATGEVVSTYVLLGEVWGSIEQLSGREFFSAQQEQSAATTRIIIRYRPGIDTTTQVEDISPAAQLGPEIYDVLHVAEDKRSGRQELQLMCERRTAEGFQRG